MGSKCKILSSRPPKGTSLRETTSYDVLIVKISAGVLAVGCRKNQKKLAESLDAPRTVLAYHQQMRRANALVYISLLPVRYTMLSLLKALA